MKSVYALRIVKPPRWVSEPTAGSNGSQYRPGLYCAGVLEAFRGSGIGSAASLHDRHVAEVRAFIGGGGQ